jgi:O-antigen ligase
VILAPAARGVCTLVIALTPLLSVAIGALIQAAGIHTMFADVHDRLEGATGNAGVFGALAFAGFAVALHESTVRPQGRSWMGALASVNLVLVILSGTRTSMLASAVLLLAYVLTSEQFRARLRRSRALALFAICLIGTAVTAYAPTLYGRVLDSLGRSGIWQRFYDEFWRSPIFGRGIGSAFITRKPLELLYAAPHNEYLHLLVVGGALGFVLCMTAIILWYSDILRNASPNDRKFLLSVAAALAIYALADNILVYPTALGLFVYLGVIGQPKDASSAIETAATRAAGSAPEADAPAGAGRGVASVRRWTTTPFEALSRDRSRYASHP